MSDIEYTALCTLDDVKTQAIVNSLDTDDSRFIVAATTEVHAVRDEVESILDRHLIVRLHSHWIALDDWVYDGDRYRVFVPEYPVVQIDTADGDPTTDYTADGSYITADAPAGVRLGYWAGYRRDDTDLTDLRTDYGLTGLATDAVVPVLPSALRSLAIDGVLYYLERRVRGVAVGSTTTLQQGGAIQQVAPVDPQWYSREVQRRAATYRRLTH